MALLKDIKPKQLQKVIFRSMSLTMKKPLRQITSSQDDYYSHSSRYVHCHEMVAFSNECQRCLFFLFSFFYYFFITFIFLKIWTSKMRFLKWRYLIKHLYETSLGLSHPSRHVCSLRRVLNGFKQAPQAWFARFSEAICIINYTQSA